MESSQDGQERKNKRSGWIIVLLILLVLLSVCCLVGGVLCWGTQRVPELLRWMYENAEEYGFEDEKIEQFFRDFEQGNFDEYFLDEFESLEELDPEGGLASCQGLNGVLEVELLVGPADAAGLESVTIGEIPFSVVGGEIISGSNYLTYEDVLEKEWGTYAVFFEGDVFLAGTCREGSNGGILDLNVEFVGQQRIEINAGGEVQKYPWSGSAKVELDLPAQDGARDAAEGWAIILHLE